METVKFLLGTGRGTSAAGGGARASVHSGEVMNTCLYPSTPPLRVAVPLPCREVL